MNMAVPYNGNEKYIFVSYSHKDSEKVLTVINRLMEEGYRVWYDQGIDPGSEWDENIAQHIQNCGYFAVFMSENYLASSNCCDELSYARDLEKERVVIYLEEVELPSGIAMRINRIQSVHMYKYTDMESFYIKLMSTNNLHICLNDIEKTVKTQTEPEFTQEDKSAEVKDTAINNKEEVEKEKWFNRFLYSKITSYLSLLAALILMIVAFSSYNNEGTMLFTAIVGMLAVILSLFGSDSLFMKIFLWLMAFVLEILILSAEVMVQDSVFVWSWLLFPPAIVFASILNGKWQKKNKR